MDILKDFFSLLFPQVCITCNGVLYKNEKDICTKCLSRLPFSGYVHDPDNPLNSRFWGKVQIDFAFSFLKFTKHSLTQGLLYNIKYKNGTETGIMMGKMFGKAILSAGVAERTDMIIPVPLHRRKLRKRGYNQSEVIAEGISSVTTRPVRTDILIRTADKRSQTFKSRLQRWLDIKEDYLISDGKGKNDLKGAAVLLVDDVITTGATLEICAEKLLKGGAGSVTVAALASAEY